MSQKSLVYVFVQLTSLAYLIISGGFFVDKLILRGIEILSIMFGVWAFFIMRNHINIFSELRGNAKLLTTGPYAYVRHPIYSALYVIGLILVIDDFDFKKLIAYFFLSLSLIAKLIYEEKLLSNAFPAYRQYKEKTKAIIPFII